MYLNTIQIIGFVGKDPERPQLQGAPLGVDTVRTNDDGQVDVSTPALPGTVVIIS